MRVRHATAADIPHIVAGIREFVGSSSYREHDAVNEPHVEATLAALIDMQDALVAVMEDDGTFAGCFVGLAHAHLFSATRMLGELFIYTDPCFRGHGSKLRRYAEEWARESGCKIFNIAHPMSEAHLERVYARWGFKPCETHYRKELS